MAQSVYDFSARRLDGSPLDLAEFRGRPLLIVNTASRCGFTPQYAGLEALHQKYGERGLVVVGFPCNQFHAQEPGDAREIAGFCERNYGVSFPLAEKVEVRGPGAHPLFRFLCARAPGFLGTRAIKWNFTKFLVDRQGRVVARYSPLTRPGAIEGKVAALVGG